MINYKRHTQSEHLSGACVCKLINQSTIKHRYQRSNFLFSRIVRSLLLGQLMAFLFSSRWKLILFSLLYLFWTLQDQNNMQCIMLNKRVNFGFPNRYYKTFHFPLTHFNFPFPRFYFNFPHFCLTYYFPPPHFVNFHFPLSHFNFSWSAQYVWNVFRRVSSFETAGWFFLKCFTVKHFTFYPVFFSVLEVKI